MVYGLAALSVETKGVRAYQPPWQPRLRDV